MEAGEGGTLFVKGDGKRQDEQGFDVEDDKGKQKEENRQEMKRNGRKKEEAPGKCAKAAADLICLSVLHDRITEKEKNQEGKERSNGCGVEGRNLIVPLSWDWRGAESGTVIGETRTFAWMRVGCASEGGPSKN